jgi:hypothetical protein
MGKRSKFQRVERDFYPTPLAAVLPLLPHLPKEVRFAEPCAGDGRLIHILEEETDAICMWASDIEPQSKGVLQDDFRDVGYEELFESSCVITNPPWDRKILHPFIEHFVFNQKITTWLLFDSDWMHTKQSAPYMKHCSDIVSIGRVKWIEGSTGVGKDNCCWYKFVSEPLLETKFHGRTE